MAKHTIPFIRNFNWRVLLLRLLINAVSLLLVAGLVPSIYFVDRSLVTLLLMALALGVLNALVKPIIQLLTLQFIFASYGLIVILINALVMWLLSHFFPERFAVDSLFWALVGGALIGLVSGLLESLLGASPPVVGDRYPDLRLQVKEDQTPAVRTLLMQSLSGSPPEALPHAPDTAAVGVAEAPVEAQVEAASQGANTQAAAGGEA